MPGPAQRWALLVCVALLTAACSGSATPRAAGGGQRRALQQASVAALLPVQAAPPLGLGVTPDVFRSNLKFIRNQVLPPGWELSPVLAWDAYGHGAATLAGAAVDLGLPVSVKTNTEAATVVAAAAAAAARTAMPARQPIIRRLVPDGGPAGYATIVDAVQRRLGIEELLSPLNQADILAAAAATRSRIPVHVYLYNHGAANYGYNYDAPEQLAALLASLDPRLVQVRGFMMHTAGDPEPLAQQLVQRFNRVVCPSAKKLAAKQPLVLHFASSGDVHRMLRAGSGLRALPPGGLCGGYGITWSARVGRLAYGAEAHSAKLLAGGLAPVLTWLAPVTALKVARQPNGATRRVAVVSVAPARYPAPSWWPGIPAFEQTSSAPDPSGDAGDASGADYSDYGDDYAEAEEQQWDDGYGAGGGAAAEVAVAAIGSASSSSSSSRLAWAARIKAAASRQQAAQGPAGEPDAWVNIFGKVHRLAASPLGDGSQVLVDVTGSRSAALGTPVCIICSQRPLAVLAKEVHADWVHVASCLSGKTPAARISGAEAPQCKVAGAAAASRLPTRLKARVG